MSSDTLIPQTTRTEYSPSALEFFFLQRLASFVARQDAARSDQERVVLAQAAFSTYLDCVDLGLADEADGILARDPLARLLWQQSRPV